MDARVKPGHDGRSSFRDGPKDQTSDAQLRIGESRDSGFDASHRPGMKVGSHTLPFSASPISSSTFGSSMVAGIFPGSPPAIFLLVPRRILPYLVFGSYAPGIVSLNSRAVPSTPA